MIPGSAVEAAARALWQTDQHDDSWAGEFTEYMDYLRSEATKALEAAAPYMLNLAKREAWDANLEIQRLRGELAKAWDEGWDTFAGFDSRPGGPYPANPYRSQA